MDDVLLIAVIGLTIALAVALVGIRRRTDELDGCARDVARKNQTRAGAEAARTAAATRESVESLEAVLPVGVLHFGQDRRIERANERAYALLDVKPGRLIGRTVMEAFLDPRAEGTDQRGPDRRQRDRRGQGGRPGAARARHPRPSARREPACSS